MHVFDLEISKKLKKSLFSSLERRGLVLKRPRRTGQTYKLTSSARLEECNEMLKSMQ